MRALLCILLTLPLFCGIANAESIDDYVSAEVTAARTNVYVGEVLQLTLVIRSHRVILGQEFALSNIEDGQLKKISDKFDDHPIDRRRVGNRIEETRRFSWQAIAASPGVAALKPTLDLATISRQTTLFMSQPRMNYHKLKVKPLILLVSQLPAAGRPQSFSGAVGDFSMKVDISPLTAAPGDVITVRTEVLGKGMLENVTPPRLTDTVGFRAYPSKQISTSPSLITEQQIIPTGIDSMEVPAVLFSFFDPASGSYRVLKEGPFKLTLRAETATQEKRYRPDSETESRDVIPPPGPPVSIMASVIAAAVALLLLITLVVHMRSHSRGASSYALAALLLFLLASAIVYMAIARSGYFRRHMYKLQVQVQGRMAPSRQAPASIVLPPNSYVKYVTCEEEWALIKYAGRQCWVPDKLLGPIE